MSRLFISIFAALVLLAGCSDEEDILPTQKTKIVSYLTGTHSPKLVAYEELEEGSDEPYFTTSGNAVYRYIAGINNPDRVNWTEVTRTSKVTVTFSAYVFTFANIVTPATSTTNLTMPYYSNDPVLIAAMEDPENHKDVIVRVGGFSDNFVLLDKRIQTEILKRTEHNA